MASVVDICNLALARLGDSATVISIDPPEGSVQAEHCARFYPIARDSLLERPPAWSFATLTESLTLLGTQPPTAWNYMYAVPNEALKILAVYDQEATDEMIEMGTAVPKQFVRATDPVLGTPVIYTDQENAIVRYVRRVEDSSLFSALFTDALAWLLASYLAGPIYKGLEGARLSRTMLEAFEYVFKQASQSDANQRRMPIEHSPPWLARR